MMKHILLAAFLFLFFVPGFVLQAGAIAGDKTVVAGIPAKFPPQYFFEHNEAHGFAIDVMNEIAKIIDLKISYQVYPTWLEVNQAMRQGSIDIIPNMGINERRARYVNFTTPLESFDIVFFIRSASQSFILKPEDLTGRKVATVRSNAAYFLLEKNNDIELVTYDSPEQALFGLLSSQVDALAYPGPVVEYLARKINLEDKISKLYPPLLEMKRAIAVRPDRQDLLVTLDAAVKNFIQTPSYAEIYAKWYGTPIPFWNVKRVVFFMSACLFLMALSLFIWRYISIRKINQELAEEIRSKLRSQKSLELVESALTETLDAIIILDSAKHLILFANKGACEIFGYDHEVLVSKQMEELLRSIKNEDIETFLKQPGHSDINRKFELEVTRKDGSVVPVDANIQYVPGTAENETGYFVFIGRDISERKKLENKEKELRQMLEDKVAERTDELNQKIEDSERLNQAMINLLEDLQNSNRQLKQTMLQLTDINKELESFSYSVSHDLRAPLRHMSGFVNLLRQQAGKDLNEESRRYIRILDESSVKMGLLIDDLLRYSRTGRREINKTDVDNNVLVQEIKGELESEITNREIAWEIAPLQTVYADRTLMKVVWTNLIENALKFTADRKITHIGIGDMVDEDGDVVFFVKDNGAGFNMKYKDKMFGVFQRLHRESEFPGTGIGLATVKRIIHRHFGNIWAEGEVGKGAAFFFKLPGKGQVQKENVTA